ncbi:hypothetical protein BGZ75_005316 [Mortierella antarctica]|nr:hypothetical protein BGZ75_005316 [Mortierella antarctica]
MSLEYYVQTTEIPVRNGFTEMPDIFICYLNMDIEVRKFWDDIQEPKLIIRNWTLERDDSTRPQFRNNPCLPYYGRLMIISLGHETVNRSAIKGFQMVFHSTEPDPSQPKNIDDDETYLRRTDIWGLLGSDIDQPEYSVLVSSALMPLGTPYSALNVVFPTTNLVYRQKLITTIPTAFSSWGGAFSVIYGVLYFLFGSPRADPFGVVGTYVFGKRNKDKLSHDYPALTENEPGEDEGQQGLLAADHSAEGSESDKTVAIEDGSFHALSKAQQQQSRHVLALESKINDIEAVLRMYYLDMALFENEVRHVPWYKKPFWRGISRPQNRRVAMNADQKMAYITVDFSNFMHFKEHLSATVSTSGLLKWTNIKVNGAHVYARRTSTRPMSEDISAWVPYGDDLCDLPLKAYYTLDGDYVEYQLGDPERQFFLIEPSMQR